MILIKTYEDLDRWLNEYSYFEEGHVLKIDMNPLVITIGMLIKGSYEANTEKEILCFKITPANVSSFDYPPNFEPSDNHYIESIEPLEVDRGFGLQINGPPTLTLRAESFTISDSEILKSIFKPWLSRNEISLQVTMKEIPKPQFWKQEFKKLGYDIVFRCYGGESEPIEKVPYPNYFGYFFQLENRVSATNDGIFIQTCSMNNYDVLMSFRQCDVDLDLLWSALKHILADIKDVKISCGNCKFTGEEWKHNFGNAPELAS